MMGSSSSDDEQKTENHVFPNLVRCTLGGYLPVDWIVTRSILLLWISMLTAIEDGDDPTADRKRRIGTGHPCYSLDLDGDQDESAVIEEWVWSTVTLQ